MSSAKLLIRRFRVRFPGDPPPFPQVIVCDAIGLDSRDYSFAYVARWPDGANAVQPEAVAGRRHLVA